MPDTPRVVILTYAPVDGKAALLPEGGNPIRIKPGEKVVFVPGNEGATNLTVTFTRKSPFGDDSHVITVKGGDTFKITRGMSANAEENKYPFDCRLFLNGLPITAIGGGEMEIIPPP